MYDLFGEPVRARPRQQSGSIQLTLRIYERRGHVWLQIARQPGLKQSIAISTATHFAGLGYRCVVEIPKLDGEGYDESVFEPAKK